MLGTNPVFTLTIITFYLLGLFCAALALLRSRTPQGATAWIVGLLTIPFFTVPIFLIFGRSKFYGYVQTRKKLNKKTSEKLVRMQDELLIQELAPAGMHPLMNSVSSLCRPGFTSGNDIQLLIDGVETYQSMLDEINQAREYIIFQFYVFRVDGIGKKFAQLLMQKAREGVRVNFLYDEIGTELSRDFISLMQEAGVNVCHFNSLSGKGHFQINFRNHRKIVVVDGKTAFVGGINIGDDYLGLWPDLGPWRDTHLKITGPSVMACQLTHAKDWYWCKQEDLKADWQIKSTNGDANVFILPTGPADEKQSCLLAHIAMVNSASKRLWIANPYLVPPEGLLDAILLAALRGVEVRVMLPSYSDAWIVMMASQVYIARLLKHGVKVYRYQVGFLHQKVMLVDDLFATIGSANLDFRSMFINFEITVIAQQEKFISDVERMLVKDFENSRELSLHEFETIGLWEKIATRAANLMAPVL